MSITRTFKKNKIFVTQDVVGFPNAIWRVEWVFEFSDGVNGSQAVGLSELDITPESFAGVDYIPIDQVTDEQLEQWIIAASFENDISWFCDYHAGILADLAASPSSEDPHANSVFISVNDDNFQKAEIESNLDPATVGMLPLDQQPTTEVYYPPSGD